MDINDLNDRFSGMTICSVEFSAGQDGKIVFLGRKDEKHIKIEVTPRDHGLYIDSEAVYTSQKCDVCACESFKIFTKYFKTRDFHIETECAECGNKDILISNQ